jgi:hypothetical protein
MALGTEEFEEIAADFGGADLASGSHAWHGSKRGWAGRGDRLPPRWRRETEQATQQESFLA